MMAGMAMIMMMSKRMIIDLKIMRVTTITMTTMMRMKMRMMMMPTRRSEFRNQWGAYDHPNTTRPSDALSVCRKALQYNILH